MQIPQSFQAPLHKVATNFQAYSRLFNSNNAEKSGKLKVLQDRTLALLGQLHKKASALDDETIEKSKLTALK